MTALRLKVALNYIAELLPSAPCEPHQAEHQVLPALEDSLGEGRWALNACQSLCWCACVVSNSWVKQPKSSWGSAASSSYRSKGLVREEESSWTSPLPLESSSTSLLPLTPVLLPERDIWSLG